MGSRHLALEFLPMTTNTSFRKKRKSRHVSAQRNLQISQDLDRDPATAAPWDAGSSKGSDISAPLLASGPWHFRCPQPGL